MASTSAIAAGIKPFTIKALNFKVVWLQFQRQVKLLSHAFANKWIFK